MARASVNIRIGEFFVACVRHHPKSFFLVCLGTLFDDFLELFALSYVLDHHAGLVKLGYQMATRGFWPALPTSGVNASLICCFSALPGMR